MKTNLMITIFIGLSLNTFAGQEVLNGGDSVVCFDSYETKKIVAERLKNNRLDEGQYDQIYPLEGIEDKVESAYLLDLYEAEQAGINLFGEQLFSDFEFAKDKNFQEILEDRMSVLEKKVPFGQEFRSIYNSSRSKWIPSESGLNEVDDSLHSFNHSSKRVYTSPSCISSNCKPAWTYYIL